MARHDSAKTKRTHKLQLCLVQQLHLPHPGRNNIVLSSSLLQKQELGSQLRNKIGAF